MSTPTPVSLLAAQAVAMAAADAILTSVGLPTYTALAARLPMPAPASLPEGVVSLDAARADRKQTEVHGRPL